ncbi:hypothetical protein [Halalkalibacter urbisdiaboli]|uniref:hypothetical protein n=1 Tax=Halalkalibacter urbisdiaboli TaxID=1960589 RepID=UPI000B447301|nr:hypothetical protein [Halalkalibacter urbisdiaboli]
MRGRWFIFVLMLSFYPVQTSASCAGGISTEEQVNHSDIVFKGTVIAIDPKVSRTNGRANDYVVFEVDSAWKGVNNTQVRLLNPSIYDNTSSSIDYEFSEGQTYVVFAKKEAGEYQTDSCMGTRLLDQAQEELSYLGEGDKPANTVNLVNERSDSTNMIAVIMLLYITPIITLAAILANKRKKTREE